MWIHLLPLGLIDGAGSGAQPPVVDGTTNSGGFPWLLNARSGLDKDGLQRARKRLGLIPDDVKTAIVEVAKEVVAKSGVPSYETFQRQQLEYERQLRERIKSIWREEYIRALREEMQRQDDDLIIWLLLSD